MGNDTITIISTDDDDTKFTLDDEATTLNVPAFQGDLWTLLYGKKKSKNKSTSNDDDDDDDVNDPNNNKQTSLDDDGDNDGNEQIEQQHQEQENKYNKYRDLQTPIKLNITSLPLDLDCGSKRKNEYSILET